jgi:hypothetical protein
VHVIVRVAKTRLELAVSVVVVAGIVHSSLEFGDDNCYRPIKTLDRSENLIVGVTCGPWF